MPEATIVISTTVRSPKSLYIARARARKYARETVWDEMVICLAFSHHHNQRNLELYATCQRRRSAFSDNQHSQFNVFVLIFALNPLAFQHKIKRIIERSHRKRSVMA